MKEINFVPSETGLMLACMCGDVPGARKRVRAGDDVDAVTAAAYEPITKVLIGQPETALTMAIESPSGTSAIVRLLLEHGARTDWVYDPLEAFFRAAFSPKPGNMAVLRAKMNCLAKASYGFDKIKLHPDRMFDPGGTEAVALLMERGALIDFKIFRRKRKQFQACIRNCHWSSISCDHVLDALRGWNSRWYKDASEKLARAAVKTRDAKLIDSLLTHGFKVDLTRLPLKGAKMLASRALQSSCNALIEKLKGAWPAAYKKLAIEAVDTGDAKLMDSLLAHGFDVDLTTLSDDRVDELGSKAVDLKCRALIEKLKVDLPEALVGAW